jgi:hypothetical protein
VVLPAQDQSYPVPEATQVSLRVTREMVPKDSRAHRRKRKEKLPRKDHLVKKKPY